jgi:hypothetical protein
VVFPSQVWFAWALFFDPGTQTGLSGYVPTAVLATAASISAAGFLFNLTFLGFMVRARAHSSLAMGASQAKA